MATKLIKALALNDIPSLGVRHGQAIQAAPALLQAYIDFGMLDAADAAVQTASEVIKFAPGEPEASE